MRTKRIVCVILKLQTSQMFRYVQNREWMSGAIAVLARVYDLW
jgi:hypothetical protein